MNLVEALVEKYQVTAAEGKPYFGSVDNISWAVCVDGVDNEFPTWPFGRQLGEHQKLKEFKKTAKSTHIGVKGKSSLPAVKREILLQGWKQFYARWGKDSAGFKDDSVEVFYK